MHRFHLVFALACAPGLLALGLPPAARATVVSGSFSGIIDGNIRDAYGLFGAVGANLSGEALTATYSYDTGAALSTIAQPNFDAYLGTDNLTLSVTIGGVTVATGVVSGSQVIDTQDGSLTAVTLSNFAPTPLIDFSLFAQGAWRPGVTINAAFTLDPQSVEQTIYASADGSNYDVLNFAAAPVPAPGPLVPIAAGLAALGWLRRGGRGRLCSPG